MKQLICLALMAIMWSMAGADALAQRLRPGAYEVASAMITVSVCDCQTIGMTGSVEDLPMEHSREYAHLFPPGFYASAAGRLEMPVTGSPTESSILELTLTNQGSEAQLVLTLDVPAGLTRADGSMAPLNVPAGVLFWKEAGNYLPLAGPVVIPLGRDETATVNVGFLTQTPLLDPGQEHGGYRGTVRATVHITGL